MTQIEVIMAAVALTSSRAIEISKYVVRACVKLWEVVSSHTEPACQLNEQERKVGSHDEAIRSLVHAIRKLMGPPPTPEK